MPFDCGPLNTSQQGMVLALFLAGLLGSFTHCVGMCSPFVVSQVATLSGVKKPAEVTFKRLSGLLLLPYHAGRVTTYILLGTLAALLSAQIMAFPAFRTISVLLFVMAGIVFLAAAIGHSNIIPLPSLMCGMPRWLSTLTRSLFVNPAGWRGYILGVMLGFIPCGLVFAAVMAVTATANPLLAAAAMGAFGLGTMPALMGVGLSSGFFLNRYRKWLKPFSAAVMVANSFMLFYMAGGWKL